MVDTRFHPYSGAVSIAGLLSGINCPDLIPDGAEADYSVTGADELETAQSGDVALAANRKYRDALSHTQAGIVVISKAVSDVVPEGAISIISDDPHLIFTKILDFLYPDSHRAYLVRLTAQSTDRQEFEDNVTLGANVVIGPEVEIGEGSIIGPNVVIGPGVTIGRNCSICANASIEYAHLGDNVIIHAGGRIGTDGFGWLDLGRSNRKVPQLGRVIIQDNVEIGANTTIDRGALGDTTIGAGTKIDNLVQVGHNCRIGRNCLIAATSGISGSTILEDGVLLGGGVGTSGHLTIGSGSIIHGRAAVTKDWPAGSKLAGAPAQDIKDFWRETAALRRLTKGSDT